MKLDKELIHSIHPNHKLRLEYTETPFYCDGCKEAGIGLKYTCKSCDIDLHKACSMAPNSLITHPFYPKCYFQFCYTPPGSIPRVCNACNSEIKGFVYNCKACGFDLHPCCANLPNVLDDGERRLFLCDKVYGPCHYCGGKGNGWCYRSKCKSYSIHVCCVKKLLMESWEAVYFNVDKEKIRRMKMRIPSLKGTLKSHHHGEKSGGKVRKCCQIAGSAVSVILSAVLGDPTVLIASVVAGFMSK